MDELKPDETLRPTGDLPTTEIVPPGLIDDRHARITHLVPDTNERYAKEKEAVLAKYPALKEDLERSFKTPQLGTHHTEGPTMESHLSLIIEGFYKLSKGEVHGDIKDEELQRLLVDTVRANPELFRDYAFLHDIAKPDCIRLTLEQPVDGEKRVEISWEDWLEIEKAGQPYTYKKDGQEVPITTIGYFHQSKGKAGNHGNVGADLIEKKLGDRKPPELILTAIRMHEIAFQQFDDNCDVDKYEEEYGSFSEEQLRFIFVASYIDFLGSENENGRPDFSPLINVLISKRNAELLRRFKNSGAKFPDNKLNSLKKKKGLLTVEELESVRLKEKRFTREELDEKLGPTLDSLSLASDDRERLFADIIADPLQWGKNWGKTLGKNVGIIKGILETCGEDSFQLA